MTGSWTELLEYAPARSVTGTEGEAEGEPWPELAPGLPGHHQRHAAFAGAGTALQTPSHDYLEMPIT